MNISHRDVKPENILVLDNNFLIGDLDSINQKNNESVEKRIEFGTLSFTSPELMKSFKKLKSKMTYNNYKVFFYYLHLSQMFLVLDYVYYIFAILLNSLASNDRIYLKTNLSRL